MDFVRYINIYISEILDLFFGCFLSDLRWILPNIYRIFPIYTSEILKYFAADFIDWFMVSMQKITRAK